MPLICAFVEEDIDYVESHRPATNHNASRHRAPERIGSGELPDRQQRSNHRYQNAGTCRPKRNRSDSVRIQVASSLPTTCCPRLVFHDYHSDTQFLFSEFKRANTLEAATFSIEAPRSAGWRRETSARCRYLVSAVLKVHCQCAAETPRQLLASLPPPDNSRRRPSHH